MQDGDHHGQAPTDAERKPWRSAHRLKPVVLLDARSHIDPHLVRQVLPFFQRLSHRDTQTFSQLSPGVLQLFDGCAAQKRNASSSMQGLSEVSGFPHACLFVRLAVRER